MSGFSFNLFNFLMLEPAIAANKTSKWCERRDKIKLQKMLIKRNPKTSSTVTMKG
jgi:hypothetical protein